MAAPSNYAALAAIAGVPFVEFVAPNEIPWSLSLRFKDEDFTAATIAVDLRTLPDIQLAAVDLTVAAPALDGADTVTDATLTAAAVEALGLPAEIGREIEYWGRVHVTPSGGDPQLWMLFKLTRLGS